MVEYMAGVWYGVVRSSVIHTVPISCRVNFAGRWAYLAGMCSELMAGTEDRAYVPQGFETAPE